MLLSNRSLLLIFLAVLQFIAPLVHAHAGQHSPHLGLHIPGLESLNVSGDLPASEPAVCYSGPEGIIFGVRDGISPKRVKIDTVGQSDLYFPELPTVIKSVTPAVDCRFSAHSPQFVSRFPALPPSPRAPPIR
ncbi:MAG: hypothetical protein ACU83O_08175 [Gammaproteobacteria bacterium]